MRHDTAADRAGPVSYRTRASAGHPVADPGLVPGTTLACPRCATDLFPEELADREGHKVHAFHCILCGTYVEPGHVPDRHVVRTVRGPRGPRK